MAVCLLFVCVTVWTCVSADGSQGGVESSLLADRVERLERLLTEQDQKLFRQDNVLHQQGEMLAKQDIKLSEQNSLLLQQASELSQQNSLILQQADKLSHQLSLISQQAVKQSELEGLLKQQGEFFQRLTDQNPPTLVHSAGTKVEDGATFSRHVGLNDDTNTSRVEDTTSSHSVIPRAGDGGGQVMEVVVSQLSQQVTEMTADIQVLKTSNTRQDRDIQDAHTSVYTHWGRSQCGSFSQLVYSGIVGGSLFQHQGAAANYLCLTRSPVPSAHPVPATQAYLYGSEYQTIDDSNHDDDAVCAVCRSTFSNTVMIPGTNVCTDRSGWHLIYSGFLMAGYHGHPAASEYICVDSAMESGAGSNANENGKLLYFTTAQCGSLPCPPYEADTVVTCAVCGQVIVI